MLEQVARRFARSRWALRSAQVLRRVGLIRAAHPIATIRLARDVRRWGPLAGAARIAARRWPDSIGLVDDRGALTFGELDRRSNALAWAWRGQGIRQDSAIGLLCRNHRGPVDAMFAAAKLGAQVVPMRTDLDREQFAEVVQREGVTTIVYDQEFAPMLAELPQRISRYLAWTDRPGADVALDELIAAAPAHELPVPAEPGGLTFLASDRAGRTRGIPCRVAPGHFAAQLLEGVPLRPEQATLVATPLCRGYGLVPFVVALSVGSTVVLQRVTDGPHLLANLVRYRCAAVVLTPRLLADLLAASGPAPSTLRVVLSSGGVLSPDLGNRATVRYGDVLYNWYCTADALLAAVATPDDWRAAPGTVGRAPFAGRLAVFAPDGGRITEAGRPGRIRVGNRFAAGPRPGTEGRLDGLVPSGAVGYVDRAGRLFIVGAPAEADHPV